MQISVSLFSLDLFASKAFKFTSSFIYTSYMKAIVFRIMMFLCWALFQESAAQTIYIAPNGNDRNEGTTDKPLASLTGARDRLRALRKVGPLQQLRVIIRKGTYTMLEPLVLEAEDSGTDSNPVVFSGEEGVVFSGGRKLIRFEKESESLWKIDIPEVRQLGWYFEQLYVNGKRAVRAKSPNDGFYHPRYVNETILHKDTQRKAPLAVQKIGLPIEGRQLLTNLNDEELADASVKVYHNWDNTVKYISSFSASDTAIFISGKQTPPWNPISTKSLLWIENVRPALDEPGEWFLDRRGTLYYKPLPGETIENTTAIAPVAEKLVIVSGNNGQRVQNIRMERISFQFTAFRMPQGGIEPAQAAAPVEAAIQIDFADKISFQQCEVAHTGGSAIWYRRACSGGGVQQSYLHDLGANGVKIGETVIRENAGEITSGVIIDNNIIRSGGHVFPSAVAVIIFHGSDHAITHNEIADFLYTGISVGWVWGYAPSPSKRNKIEFNHIHHLGWGLMSDMGGVYTLGASEGTVVRNNVIHHIYSFDYGGWGLYTDEGSTGIIMENNLVYACKSSGFHQHYGRDNIIRNNIFANNIKAQLQATRVEPHNSFYFTNNIVYYNNGGLLSSRWSQINYTSGKNIYWSNSGKGVLFDDKTFQQWQQEGKDKQSVVADPLFGNAAENNFQIRNTKLIRQTGFKPFDYKKAGVYGSDHWKRLARFDPELEQAYDRQVARHELRKE